MIIPNTVGPTLIQLVKLETELSINRDLYEYNTTNRKFNYVRVS